METQRQGHPQAVLLTCSTFHPLIFAKYMHGAAVARMASLQLTSTGLQQMAYLAVCCDLLASGVDNFNQIYMLLRSESPDRDADLHQDWLGWLEKVTYLGQVSRNATAC